MSVKTLEDIPRYHCLLKAAEAFPTLDPAAFAVFLEFVRTSGAVIAAETRYLARYNISHGRFTVLMLLHRGCPEARTPAALADESNVSRATMTGLVDTLERDGMVTRAADAADRRTLNIRLTPRGEACVKELLPGYFSCVSEIIKPLSRAEQDQIVGLMAKIQDSIPRETDPEDRECAKAVA